MPTQSNLATQLSENSAVLKDTVEYHWLVGCAPTAVSMIVGYWDRNGYDGLIAGDSTYYSDDVKIAIASNGHLKDYYNAEGYSGSVLGDISDYNIFGTHENDSIADFMYSSRSSQLLNDGWSLFGVSGPGFTGYAAYRGYDNFTTANIYWDNNQFNTVANEIDAGRPVILDVDSDGDSWNDHEVVVFGYDKVLNSFLIHDGWERTDEMRWISATGLQKGQEFGITSLTTIKPAEFRQENDQPNFLNFYDDNNYRAAVSDGFIRENGELTFELNVADSWHSRTGTIATASTDGHTFYNLYDDGEGSTTLSKALAAGDGTHYFIKMNDNSGLSNYNIDFATADGREFFSLYDDGIGSAALYKNILQSDGTFSSESLNADTGFDRLTTKGFSTVDGESFQVVVDDGYGTSALYEAVFDENWIATSTLITSDSGLNRNTLSHVTWGNVDPVVDDTPNKRNITGTSGDDYLFGTDGTDTILGGDGMDVIVASNGDDFIDGEGGDYNQVDYTGAATDYTFARQSDGSILVSHAEMGKDTLQNIDGFWFTGESKWYSVEYLLIDQQSPIDPGGINLITGTSGDDFLFGTDGVDTMLGGDGMDVFVASRGDDSIDGEGGDYNQVDYTGAATDYTFARQSDGSILVSHAEMGKDTLQNIDGFWFTGESKWYSVEDLLIDQQSPIDPGGINLITGTSGDDFLFGTDGADTMLGGDGMDVFVASRGDDSIDGEGGDYNQVDYSGAATDYTFARQSDGSILVSHAEMGKDTLQNIDGFWFTGEENWYSVEEMAA